MERFLSEGRQGLPDIDLDVESARRIEAYRVIFDAYGERAGRLRVDDGDLPGPQRDQGCRRRARAAAARDRRARKSLPAHPGRPHRRSALPAAGTARQRAGHPQLTTIFQLAQRLDGLPRHVAMHPCGVVLSNATLLDRTPVERSIEGMPLSHFDSGDVETAGMIKLDVLGVRMQSAMAHTLAEIERTTGEQVDIDAIGTRDEPTFELIRSARTLGCFQIESPGQRELVGKLLPRHIGDLIVDISLFRPGPVNSDMITPYLETRHGRRPARFPHPDLVQGHAD